MKENEIVFGDSAIGTMAALRRAFEQEAPRIGAFVSSLVSETAETLFKALKEK